MASKTWSDFFDWVLPHVPGCLQIVAEDAIREAAIEFCDRTMVFKRDLTIDAIAGGTGLYDMSALLEAQFPADGAQLEIVSIQEGSFNATPLDPATDAELKFQYGVNWATTTGLPRFFNMKDENTARFAPISDTALAAGFAISVAVVPSQDAAIVDAFLWTTYRKEIARGALAALMQSPKKPYTNATLSKQHAMDFANDCSTVATNKKNNYTRKPLRSAPVRA